MSTLLGVHLSLSRNHEVKADCCSSGVLRPPHSDGPKEPKRGLSTTAGPDPRKVDTSGVSYAAWVSVADVSASKASGARRLHQECRLRVL